MGGWRGRPFEFVRKSQNDYVLSSFTNDEISSLKFELSRVKRATLNSNFGLVNLTMKSQRSNLSSRSVWFSFVAKSPVRGSRKSTPLAGYGAAEVPWRLLKALQELKKS